MSDIKPATPFWAGYLRSPEGTVQLLAALEEALKNNPTQRLGQLLTNTFGDDLWHVWDEDIVEAFSKEILPW